ncbi:MAG: phosphopantetheine-binding protein [Candidatus Omnitrophica bacterium]|nr:phosphopantetheine-binding protein [Candidatus Omnitrophota bacterium]
MALKEDVINAIADILDVEAAELTDNAKLYDSVGVDSTEMVELCVALGKRFAVKIENSEITKFSTPLEITQLIEKKK